MKTVIITCFSLIGFICNAQPKVLDHAIIITKAKLKIVNGSETERNQTTSSFGNTTTHINSVNGMMEGDNRIETYYKDDKIKAVSNIGMGGTNTIIMDKKTNKTITLVEIMGTKTGFYTTEENFKQMQKIKDSILKKPFSQMQKTIDSSKNINIDSLNIQIDYHEENKKIAGYNCKIALIKTRYFNGDEDSAYVWYCPEFKLKPGFNNPTGLTGTGLAGFELLNGFPMKYEVNNFKGNKISIEVKKINLDKDIKDKEFEVPKGFDLNPMNILKTTYQTKTIN